MFVIIIASNGKAKGKHAVVLKESKKSQLVRVLA